MPNSRVAETADHLNSLHRLIASRWLVLGVLTLAVLLIPEILDIPLPQLPVLGIVAIAAIFNGLARHRLQREHSASAQELLSQLLIDIATLSAIVFFCGGATNPLVSLLLPSVAIAALTLPGRHVAVVGVAAIAAYSLLMVHYLPLAIGDASRATQLHLGGMWLIFAISTALIGWLIVRMMRTIRTRDAELAAAREQALRDERVTAMGTLAAGAAHELGTPLATMALLAGELANEPSLPAPLREDIALLRQQIGVCKEIITGLSRRAGAERLENAPIQAVDRWLESLHQRWHAVRPQMHSRLTLRGEGEAPEIVADPRLEQSVLNLLNNAANASQQTLEIILEWNRQMLALSIHDHGPGFPPEVLELGGISTFPAHERGCGVGLMLTRSAIEQLGGRLILSNPDAGGALARIELPLNRP